MAKFVIDIDLDNPLQDHNGHKVYKAKGFNSLVFDETGLQKLETCNEDFLDNEFTKRITAILKGLHKPVDRYSESKGDY